jgi:hypothetical protein
MCTHKHAKVDIVELAASRLLVVENIRVGIVDMGSRYVTTTIGPTVCRWQPCWLTCVAGYPKLARAKSLKLRHHQPVCGRLRPFYRCVYKLDSLIANTGHGTIQGSGSDKIFTGSGPRGMCARRFAAAPCSGRRRRRLLPSRHASSFRFDFSYPRYLKLIPPWSRVCS